MNNDSKKKEIMKKMIEKKGKGGPGSGSVGQYSMDDPTKAAANLDGGGVDNPTKPTPNATNGYPQEDRTPNGRGGPGYAPQTPFAKAKLPKIEMEGKGGPGMDSLMGTVKKVGQRVGDVASASKFGPLVKGAASGAMSGARQGLEAGKEAFPRPSGKAGVNAYLGAGIAGVAGAGKGAVDTFKSRFQQAKSNDSDQMGKLSKGLSKVLSPSRFSTMAPLKNKIKSMPAGSNSDPKRKEYLKKKILDVRDNPKPTLSDVVGMGTTKTVKYK